MRAKESSGSARTRQGPGGPWTPFHTDWLRNELTVSGPATSVARFRQAAQGPGTIPWPLDLDHETARLLAPMAADGIEARLLAQDLRDTIEANHARALNPANQRRCPLDLHRLIPVPATILARGDDHPEALHWLRTHWGTTWPLRHVRALDRHADRRLRRSARFVVEFWSADWTPWQAIRQLRRDWPDLVLDIRPHYDNG